MKIIRMNMCKNKIMGDGKKQSGLNGSFTLEASFVMPVVVFIVLTLIFLGYSLYDQCMWEERMQDGFLLANQWGLHPTEFDTGEIKLDNINEREIFFRFFGGLSKGQELFENFIADGKEKMFISDIEVSNTEFGIGGLSYKALITRNIPDMLKSYSSDSSGQKKASIRLHHPAEFLRGYAVLDELCEGTKGLSELKEKAGDLLDKCSKKLN